MLTAPRACRLHCSRHSIGWCSGSPTRGGILTRFLDLNKVNKRHYPDDFNEDEIASGSEPDEDDAVMTCSLLQGDSAPPMTWPRNESLPWRRLKSRWISPASPAWLQRLQRTRLLSTLSSLVKHDLLLYLDKRWSPLTRLTPTKGLRLWQQLQVRQLMQYVAPPADPFGVTSSNLHLYEPATAPHFRQRR